MHQLFSFVKKPVNIKLSAKNSHFAEFYGQLLNNFCIIVKFNFI